MYMKHRVSIELSKIILSGYNHYSRTEERIAMYEILMNDGINRLSLDDSFLPLAPQRLRSFKNGIIVTIAVVCRHAADLGADSKSCYALSDYYIYEIEKLNSDENWKFFLIEILTSYKHLVQDSILKDYSLPIRTTIRYIHEKKYSKLTLKILSENVGLHASYLSTKFKKEVGSNISNFITNVKLEEAVRLMRDYKYSISEIAEILSFISTSYFTKRFKEAYNLTPSEYQNIIQKKTSLSK